MSGDYDTENFATLYSARKNVIDILEKQNYTVEEYSGFKTGELHSMIKNSQLDMLVENSRQKVYVKFFEICEKKPKLLNKQVINDMIEDLFVLENILESKDTLMIISNADANDTMKSHIRHIWEEHGFSIIIINIKSLRFNILEHKYVPPHTILSEEEDKEFRSKYNVKNDNCIPEISRFDPVAQVICMKPKQICKITRASKNAVEANYFRICKNK
jgi:DNA-directed RNA polymerase subunit H (RpoH/RPB5)